MPDWLHRTDKQLFASVPVDELPEAQANYILEPDLSAVVGFASKYWIITGDIVTLMDQAARDAVDAAEAAQAIVDNHATCVAAPDDPLTTEVLNGIQFRALVELLNKRDNYIINRLIEIQNNLIAFAQVNGNATARIDSLPETYLATNVRTRADAIQDYKDDVNSGNSDT